MADDEFTASSDESKWWHEGTFFYVPDSYIEDECQRLRASNLTTDELIKKLAECTYENLKSFAQIEGFTNDFGQIEQVQDSIERLVEGRESNFKKIIEIQELKLKVVRARADLTGKLGAYTGVKAYKKEKAANAANSRHDKPEGARAKAHAIKNAWASGKYSSRDICAEQECAALDMSFSAARRALRNTPEPT